MARAKQKRAATAPPKPAPAFPSPCQADYNADLDPPWAVVGYTANVSYVLAGCWPAGDVSDQQVAERIADALSATDGIPTEALKRNVLGRLWIYAASLCDLVEGKPTPVDDLDDLDAYRTHTVMQTRQLLAFLNEPLKGES